MIEIPGAWIRREGFLFFRASWVQPLQLPCRREAIEPSIPNRETKHNFLTEITPIPGIEHEGSSNAKLVDRFDRSRLKSLDCAPVCVIIGQPAGKTLCRRDFLRRLP